MQGMEPVPGLTQALDHEPSIVCAYLYGSRARGTARPDSDVDVAVLLDSPGPNERVDLEARLCVVLRREVQVVLLDSAPADLVRRVLRDGILLVDRDRARRLTVEVKKRNEYFDMTPIWRRIRRLPPGVSP